jgi:hypothetical protein
MLNHSNNIIDSDSQLSPNEARPTPRTKALFVPVFNSNAEVRDASPTDYTASTSNRCQVNVKTHWSLDYQQKSKQ